MADLTDILDYYAGLLIIQYKQKTKARETIKLSAKAMMADGLFLDLRRCFDLDTAVGVQLDVLGRIVGVSREIKGLDLDHEYLALSTYADEVPTEIGLALYSDTADDYYLTHRYIIDATHTMTDDEFRAIIRIKIIRNSLKATFKNIKEKLYEYFSGNIDIAPEESVGSYVPMSIVFSVTDTLFYRKIIEIAEFLNIMPVSCGCGYSVNYV